MLCCGSKVQSGLEGLINDSFQACSVLPYQSGISFQLDNEIATFSTHAIVRSDLLNF